MFEFDTVRALTLFVSGSCNLNCSYCYIHKNPALKIIDKEIRDAWRTGTYIKNIKKVFNKMKVDPKNITGISFWGGESTLHLDLINDQLKDLFELCPNIDNIGFSTNFMCGIDETLRFLSSINQVANVPQSIWLQQSIDGPEGVLMERGHTGNWDTYMANYKKLAYFLNNEYLPKIKNITVTAKPTVDKDLYLEYFSDENNQERYIEYLNNFYNELIHLFVNSKVNIGMMLPKPAVPMEYSISDAYKLKEIMIKWEKLTNKFVNNLPNNVVKCYSLGVPLHNYIQVYSENQELFPARAPGCYKNRSEFAILPDGTLTDCTSNYMLARDDYESMCSNSDRIVSQLYKHMNYNPLKLSDEELEDAVWLNVIGLKFSRDLFNNLTYGLAKEMALSNQINKRFAKNSDATLSVARLSQYQSSCTIQQILTTRVPFLINTGTIKMHAIGLYDEFYTENLLDKKTN